MMIRGFASKILFQSTGTVPESRTALSPYRTCQLKIFSILQLYPKYTPAQSSGENISLKRAACKSMQKGTKPILMGSSCYGSQSGMKPCRIIDPWKFSSVGQICLSLRFISRDPMLFSVKPLYPAVFLVLESTYQIRSSEFHNPGSAGKNTEHLHLPAPLPTLWKFG